MATPTLVCRCLEGCVSTSDAALIGLLVVGAAGCDALTVGGDCRPPRMEMGGECVHPGLDGSSRDAGGTRDAGRATVGCWPLKRHGALYSDTATDMFSPVPGSQAAVARRVGRAITKPCM